MTKCYLAITVRLQHLACGEREPLKFQLSLQVINLNLRSYEHQYPEISKAMKKFSGSRFKHDLPNQNPRFRNYKWPVAKLSINSTNKFKFLVSTRIKTTTPNEFQEDSKFPFQDITELCNL